MLKHAYKGVSQDMVKAYVRHCACNQERAAPPVKRKRQGTAQSAPSAWFRIELDLISMEGEPCSFDCKTYSYILRARDQYSAFNLLAPLETRTCTEVASHLLRWFCEHGPPKVLHMDQGRAARGLAKPPHGNKQAVPAVGERRRRSLLHH